MTYYIKNGSDVFITSKEDMELDEVLAPGNYTIKFDPMKGYFLSHTESFEMPPKFYGDTIKTAYRILSTFKSRPATTGVLLEGEKGSGKTLLAKYISYSSSFEGIPTLLVNAQMFGSLFNSFIERIEQPVIVLIDEFEKIYERANQEQLLTLLDGTVVGKKLFILTVNDKYATSTYLHNRPGRIFYSKTFTGLDPVFITEYVEDNLLNKENIAGVIRLTKAFNNFNFDMLKALIEEMNRYNETAVEAIQFLNISMNSYTKTSYNIVRAMWNGVITPPTFKKKWSFNPFLEDISFYYEYELPEDQQANDPNNGYIEVHFSPSYIVSVDSGKITYRDEDSGNYLIIELKQEQSFDYYSVL